MVPQWFYYWAQAERKHPSFTALEKRMLILFFYWAVSRTRPIVTIASEPFLCDSDCRRKL